jgi:transcriptional regulator with XRE-family HTH domain
VVDNWNSQDSKSWLRNRLKELDIKSLDQLSEISGIDPGSISRYFSQERRPSIDVVEPLSKALNVSTDELLRVLGAKREY